MPKLILDDSDLEQIANIAAQNLLNKVLSSVPQICKKPFPKIGEFWPEQGGYLGAVMRGRNGQADYCLIVAAEGNEFTAEFGPDDSEIDTCDFDGAANTKQMVESDLDFPAAEKCAALKIGNHNDFYLASCREMRALSSSSSELFDRRRWYWSSTQFSRASAFYHDLIDGKQGPYVKSGELRVRPVRRVFI